MRFARLRLEKRHNYIRKCAEAATQMYITNDKPNVSGIVLAGSAEFKAKLNASELFDPRLAAIVTKIVDVSYGGENGFNQAIELAAESLANVKFVKEKKLISSYFSEISQDTGRYCFGVQDTLYALETGAIETLIVWESLDIMRYSVENSATKEQSLLYLTEAQLQGSVEHFKDNEGNDLDVLEEVQLLEWLANNFKTFGAKLEFVTNRSQEGSQFCKGFGGIGGLLRYQVDFAAHEVVENDTTTEEAGGYDSNNEFEDFI